MNRYVKVPSNQAGKFNFTTLNRVDFDLDPGMVYDLKNSYVELYMNVDASESTSSVAEGIYKVKVQNKKLTDAKFYNVSLVKNCHLRSSNVGYLEDIRAVNTLRSSLKELQLSSAAKETETHREISALFDVNELKSTIFRELHKEGTVKSRDVQAPIRIRMEDLFNLGSLREFDCRKLGRTRVHIELDDVLQIVPQTVEDILGGDTHVDCEDLSDSSDLSVLESSDIYQELEDSPFWVSMVCNVTADGSGGAAAIDLYRRIDSISYASDGSIDLTLNNPLPSLNPGETYENVRIIPVPASSISPIQVDYCELTTQVVSNPSEPMEKMVYTTWTNEQLNAGGVSVFQKLYQVEPEAICCVAMYPEKVSSVKTDIADYRFRVDGVDQTNRNIKPYTPLYYQFMNEAMLSIGYPLNNLNETALSVDEESDDKRLAANKLLFHWAKLEQTQREKNVQLNINTDSSTVDELNLYKLVAREV